MSTYSIKDLEHLTGVKAHTIRIWEQRYGIISPKRTDTNIRFYCCEDLKHMLNISLLNNNGFKISKIAKMSREEVREKVLYIIEKNNNFEDQISGLTVAMIELDEARFENIMSTNVLQLGFEATMVNIVYPFLAKVGFLWQTNAINPAQEHFISNLIRQKLIVAIDGQLRHKDDNKSKYLLYLTENEMHEVGLLFANYLIRQRGNPVAYLGQDLPFGDLQKVFEIYKPDYMVTLITSMSDIDAVQQYLYDLSKAFPDTTVLVSGFQVLGQDLDFPENIELVTHIKQLIEFVDEENTYTEKKKVSSR